MDPSTEPAIPLAVEPTGCTATGCGWYHGAWPVLRALGLVATPHRHTEFFDTALGSVAASGGRRVLVSGAADPAMAQLVVGAFAARGIEPAVTVLDRCPTPVDRTLAAVPGAVGWVSDVFEIDGPARFDALCTHGLFPLVPVEQRSALADRWASVLVPGGRIVTTSSLSEPGAPIPLVFDDAGVDAFVDRALVAAAEIDVGVPVDVVTAMARVWARRAATHPVFSSTEIVEVLDAAGFDSDVREREIHGSLGSTRSGPWSARSAVYAEIVATRR